MYASRASCGTRVSCQKQLSWAAVCALPWLTAPQKFWERLGEKKSLKKQFFQLTLAS